MRDYKNISWLCGTDRKIRPEGKCSASRGLPSDAEQLSRVTDFQFASNNHCKQILFIAYSCFDDCIKACTCVISSISYWNKYIFDQEMFGSAPIYDVLTSCTRSSYTPWYKTEISRTGENRGKPCLVCLSGSALLIVNSVDCLIYLYKDSFQELLS